MAALGQPVPALTYDEAEQVAIGLIARWQGITGQVSAPSLEQVADLVQRVLRDAAEVAAARGEDAAQ